jgi:hypothetical protein
MLKNSGKNWSSTEEQELLNHMNVYNGNVDIIAELHGRSTTAINMRLELLIRRMIEIEKESKAVVAQKFRKSLDEINEILKQQKPSSANNPSQAIMDRLDRIEKLLEKVAIRQNKLLRNKGI